jgi:hypothetical protein
LKVEGAASRAISRKQKAAATTSRQQPCYLFAVLGLTGIYSLIGM